jgi:hypothetical protein
MAEVLRPARPAAAIQVSGELVKAVIVNTTTGVSHAVMYNPEEIKFEQGNAFAEIAIPGLNASPIQYVRGKPRTLTMELFFDSYETGEDVRAHTAPIVALLDKQPQTQAPPVLLFSLGRLQFRCVLADAGQRYTMFLRDGTPVRSTMSVRLQEYVEVSVETRSGLFFGSPTLSAAVSAVVDAARSAIPAGAAVHVVGRGDTLSGLAATYLGDPSRWRLIADANRILDPLSLGVGTSLVIPSPGPSGGRP